MAQAQQGSTWSQAQQTSPTVEQDWEAEEHWGWRMFAATMLFIGGIFNVIDGLVAVYRANYFTSLNGHAVELPVTNSLHTWGWVAFAVGLVLVGVGLALYATAATWARVLGIILASINMIFQLSFMAAFPLWSFTMILVDAFVIYGLAVSHRGEAY